MISEWSDEVLFPSANAVGYRLIFEAETWLRRICWAALLLSAGPAWATTLDDHLRKNLERQSQSNSARWYLGVDAEEELLWSTTHGQLATLLRMDSIRHHLRRICGVPGEILAQRLQSIAQIRNTLAHNRAISDDSLRVLGGDLTIIRAAAGRFKSKTLYANPNIVSDGDDAPENLREFLHSFGTLRSRVSDQQLFVAADEDFVSLVRLPVSPFDQWPDGSELRTRLGSVAHLLLCVLVNKMGDEMQIVLPRSLPLVDKLQVLERFMTTGLLRDAWTNTPPNQQNPAASCWPRLWFYENRPPSV
ncbi:hypothetical protein [Mycobacteroides abscessus]|uniref:hypothetical protein n=1 Tax=Mycobacteroides abscessus TaxID=36809 RepID=UPI000940CEC3|nr:hypothetical protein [Mycobacteroides abscessus]